MLTRFITSQGYKLAAEDGDMGQVREFYFDDQSWDVRYLVVDAGSWLINRPVLIIPEVLGQADPQTNTIAVRLTKDAIRDSPPIETDKPVSRQREEELHRHYKWQPYWRVPPAAALLASAPAPTAMPVENAPSAGGLAATPGDPHLRSSAELAQGYSIQALDGEVGSVYDFVLDDREWKVRYLVVRTGPWLVEKDVLLAPDWTERISYRNDQVLVNLPRAAIKDAPDYDVDAPISRAYEQRLYDHYQRRRYWSIPEAAGKVA